MIRWLLPILLLALAGAGTWALMHLRTPPPKNPPKTTYPWVDTQLAKRQSITLKIPSQGHIRAQQQADLVAEGSGKVVSINDLFLVGQQVQKGQLLVQLDPRDAELSVRRARAQLAQAEQRLTRIRAEAQQAKVDWQHLGKSGEPSALTLKRPQVDEAKAQVQVAETELQSAELALSRVQIRAPMDGQINLRQVVLGQYLSPGQRVGQLQSHRRLEVPLTLHRDMLDDLPALATQPRVRLRTRSTHSPEWRAHIAYDQGHIDPSTHLYTWVARLAPHKQPPRIGQFVFAEIEGHTLAQVFVLPASALRDEQQLYLLDEHGRLQTRHVQVLRYLDKQVVISDGLQEGERVITSTLDIAVPGMSLRTGAAP